MNELQAIVEAAETARRHEKEVLLATVVGIRGSAYRRPGARMLLTSDGWQAGSISGGCLEGDILRRAWWHTRTGEPALVTYDSTVDEDADSPESELSWGFGLGCNGVVEVLLERLSPGVACCPVGFIARCLQRNRPGVLATVVAVEGAEDVLPGQRLLLHQGDEEPIAVTLGDRDLRSRVERDARRLLEIGGSSRSASYSFAGEGATAEVFLEVVTPPISLLICGAGHDAVPLSTLAKNLGWKVTVVDPRPGVLPHPERFPGADAVFSCAPQELARHVPLDERTLCVVMSHNVFQDAALLESLLPSAVRYIGVLGPRRRTERLLASLGRQGEDHRLHGPVGLDIGADAPQTIALSILAEMQAVLAGRSGSFLRDRETPIHDPLPRHGATAPASRHTEKAEPVLCAL
jgi:xanthine/CO dehydrogenase XdhC/CoxF family maturation factor